MRNRLAGNRRNRIRQLTLENTVDNVMTKGFSKLSPPDGDSPCHEEKSATCGMDILLQSCAVTYLQAGGRSLEFSTLALISLEQ